MQFGLLFLYVKLVNNFVWLCWQCKRLVLQYTPLILMNSEKFFEKNDICTAVRACQVSREPSVESVVPEKSSADAWSGLFLS